VTQREREGEKCRYASTHTCLQMGGVLQVVHNCAQLAQLEAKDPNI